MSENEKYMAKIKTIIKILVREYLIYINDLILQLTNTQI